MKKKSVIRIWLRFKEDGLRQEKPCNIHFKSIKEAEKCIQYMNSKIKNEDIDYHKYGYFYRHETLVEYETAQEYIAEQESKKEFIK